MQRQIGIALLAQQPDKFFLQFCLTLVAVRAHLGGFIGSNNGIFIGSRNDIEKGHFKFLLQFILPLYATIHNIANFYKLVSFQ